MDKVLVGYSKVDITPSWETEMVGFDRPDNKSKGILDSLYAQILVFDNNGMIYGLITIDSLGFTVELTDKLRNLIAMELNTNIERIMVCFSHTHSAPNPAIDTRYYDYICKKIVERSREALKSNRICKAGWENVDCSIGINRRGKEYTDNQLGILKIVSEDGNFKLLLLRVVAHANVLSADNYLLSSDYFGATRDKIKSEFNS